MVRIAPPANVRTKERVSGVAPSSRTKPAAEDNPATTATAVHRPVIPILLQPEDSRLLDAAIASGRFETSTAYQHRQRDVSRLEEGEPEHCRFRDTVEHRTEDDRRAGCVKRGATDVLAMTDP